MCPSDLIAEGRRLLAEATPGPWEIDDERSRYEGGRYLNGDLIADDDDCIHGIHGPGGAAIVKTDCGVYPPERPDAALICWARNNLPRLLDGLQGLTAERDTYRDELKARDGHQAAEWMGARLHRQLIGEVTTERDALKAEVERLREERDVLASEHAECPDRQKAALVLLSERAQLQEAFERATKKAATLTQERNYLRTKLGRLRDACEQAARCYDRLNEGSLDSEAVACTLRGLRGMAADEGPEAALGEGER
jgi:hypothetical protein